MSELTTEQLTELHRQWFEQERKRPTYETVVVNQPDEDGMAYIAIGRGNIQKTIQRTVNLDLNKKGEIVGIEIFASPRISRIKGENK